MSSILNALKKIESEGIEQQKVQSLSRTVRLKKRGNGSASIVKSPRFARLTVGLVLLCTAGAIALGIFFGRSGSIYISSEKGNQALQPLLPESSISKEISVLEKAPTLTSGAESIGKLPEQAIVGNENPSVPLQEALVSKTAPMAKKPLKKLSLSPVVPSRETIPEITPVKKKTPKFTPSEVINGITAENHKTGPAESARTFQERGKESAEIIRDSNLKLMAIAWSENPKSRMAVINGRIVREGDVVAGMTVYHINEDDVIFRKENDLQKLLFRLK